MNWRHEALHGCLRSLAALFLLWPLSAAGASAVAAPVTSTQPANVFQASQPLVFTVAAGVTRPYRWRVTDWRERQWAQGIVTSASPQLSLPTLPLGYYELQLEPAQSRKWDPPLPFARVVDASSRAAGSASPYGVNSIQSKLVVPGFMGSRLQPPDAARLCTTLEWLAGISMLRDGIPWNTKTNPAPGRYLWRHSDHTASLLAQRDIQILGVLSHAPSWDAWRPNGGIPDLMALYRFSRRTAAHFAGRVTAWETWNEEDGDPTMTAWDFAAAEKAAYLGLHAGDPRAQVLNGPIALVVNNAAMLRVMLRNGLGDYFDAFSFHGYYSPQLYPSNVAAARGLLASFGLAGKPLWVTEAGLAQEGDGRHAPLQPGSGLWEHDNAQARWQARRLVKAEVELHALGVARVFFFVLPPFNEQDGHKVWGLLRWDWTVKPAYVALATLTAELSHSRYLGRLEEHAEGTHAYLFRQESENVDLHIKTGTQTLVLWSGARRTITLPAGPDGAEETNLLGRTEALRPASDRLYHISIGPTPIYVNGLGDLEARAPAPALAAAPPKAAGKKDLLTVLRIRLGRGFSVTGQGAANMRGQAARAVLDVYNFSQRWQRGIVEDLSRGCRVAGLPASLTIRPMGSAHVPITLRCASALTLHPLRPIDLELGGRFGGESTDPVVVPLAVDSHRLARMLEAHRLARSGSTAWIADASGRMRITHDGLRKATRVDVVFPSSTGGWLYRGLRIEQPRPTLAKSVGISFQIKVGPLRPKAPSLTCLVVAVPKSGIDGGWPYDEFGARSYMFFPHTAPANNWRTIYIWWYPRVAPAGFDPGDTRILRIGCNPQQRRFTFWLRRLRVYSQPSASLPMSIRTP